VQIAAIIALNECEDETKVYNDVYRSRRDALIEGLERGSGTVTTEEGPEA
jgi:aspartate/methionine/tyrosine aminotransferase